MSDEKPFAEVRSTPPSFFLYVGGRCLRDANVSKRLDEHASALNSAVAARERKAAAQALRDLAASIRCATGVRDPKPSDPFWRDYFATVAETQASLIEGGAT